MKLHYFRCSYGNFGDDLNLWFWDQVLPGWRDWDEDRFLIGIGSILTRGQLPEGPKLVLGTGSGYGALPDISGPEWDVRGVRGPLTCRLLGLPPELSLSDPAVLLPLLPPFREVTKTAEVLLVPHISSDRMCDWDRICASQGIGYQSPSEPFLHVVARIAGADKVIAESMHAAIIADAFGVPWHAVEISKAFNQFKWDDWAESLDMLPIVPQRFFGMWRHVQRLSGLKSNRPDIVQNAGHSSEGPTLELFAKSHVVTPGRSGRKPYLNWFASGELGKAKASDFRMSDRQCLGRQQERLWRVIDQVSRDYGKRGHGAPTNWLSGT